VHEPCPLSISPDEQKSRGWLISTPDEEKRKHGVESVIRSIDLAHRLGAPLLIVHSGQVSTPHNMENRLRKLYQAGAKDSLDYEAIKQRMIAERAQAAGPHLDAVKKSLLELMAYASTLGVRLGLENRDRWDHIPNLEEMEELLSLGSPENLGFWFDCGHAAKMDQLGFFSFESWLQRFSTRMVGCHLHDMYGLEDHLSPGMGDMDFDLIARYLPDDILRTLELHPRLTAQQVMDGVRTLSEKGLVKSC
jgi:sugar phosphate isomerase/epimerase